MAVVKSRISRFLQNGIDTEVWFKGLQSFARQQYPDALALFLASWKIKHKSIVLYNIAMCYKALFQYRRAINAFEQYIKRRGKRLRSPP